MAASSSGCLSHCLFGEIFAGNDGVTVVVILSADGHTTRLVGIDVGNDLHLGAGRDGDIKDFAVLGKPGVRPPTIVADADGSQGVDVDERPVYAGKHACLFEGTGAVKSQQFLLQLGILHHQAILQQAQDGLEIAPFGSQSLVAGDQLRRF